MARIASVTSHDGGSSGPLVGPASGANGAGAATSGTLTGGPEVVVSPGVVVDEAVLVGGVDDEVVAPGAVDVVDVPPGAVPTARPRSIRPTPYSASRPFGPRSWAVARSRSMAAVGVRPVLRSTASAPDTCGAAIDVPAKQAYSLWWPLTQYVERMPFGVPPVAQSSALVSASPPGAATGQRASASTDELVLLYDARVSARVVAVTITACSSENPAGRMESLPAAITAMAPFDQAYSTASQNAQPRTLWTVPPPRLRLITSAP